MFDEDDLVPLSAIQHLLYCARQCALIHLERVWDDNTATLEGSHLHRRADETGPRREVRGDRVTLRGVPLRSLRLGISGRADVVELRRAVGDPAESDYGAVAVEGLVGRWEIVPVEYKRGRPKANRCDEVQLCAQAICLEESLGAVIERGDLFYGKLRRRVSVVFDADLRALTEQSAETLHELLRHGETPPAMHDRRCAQCSLHRVCMPELSRTRFSARQYIERRIGEVDDPGGAGEP